MKPLSSREIRGNWATLLLPLRSDDSIDRDLLAREIDRLIEFRVDGIYSNGTAGEFFTQSEEEFRLVNEMLAERCERAGTPFQIGASHMSPQTMLGRVEIAREFRPSAIQVILPDWFPLTNEEAADYLNRAAERADGIGLVLYNPPHSKRGLKSGDFLYLLDHVDNLVGMKVADGGADWYEAMRPVFSRASVFVPGHHLATGVREGALGAYSNVACLAPGKAQKWADLTLTDLARALELEKEIRFFWDGFFAPYIAQRGYANFAVDKFAAFVGGWTQISARVRFPYKAIPEADADALRRRLPELLPGFWAL